MRIEKVREYLIEILDSMLNDKDYMFNIEFLDKEIDNYSLNRIPIDPILRRNIDGTCLKQEVYNFTSKKPYSADLDTNLNNIGFYEQFEDIVYSNNKKRILPKIDNIESIECLNCGSVSIADTQECILSIQIRITWMEGKYED